MISAEQELWRAVIRQALVDATSCADTLERSHAINWLTKPNRDFIEACRLADYDPDYIRTKAKAAIERETSAPNEARVTRLKGAKVYEHNGKALTIAEWADEIGISKPALYDRLRRGWSLSDALSKGRHERQNNAASSSVEQTQPTHRGWGQNFKAIAPDRISPTAQDRA